VKRGITLTQSFVVLALLALLFLIYSPICQGCGVIHGEQVICGLQEKDGVIDNFSAPHYF